MAIFHEKLSNFARFGKNLQFLHLLYHPFHGPYYFSDFQHHWHGFSEIMTQKVQKSAHFGPQIS